MSIDFLRQPYRRILSGYQLLTRRLREGNLRRRWVHSGRQVSQAVTKKTNPDTVFSRLDTVVINLDSRPDRLVEFSDEMARLGITPWRRLPAIDGRVAYPELPPFYSGSIGCSLSHAVALDEGRWDEFDAMLVCEDDVEFLVDKETLALAIAEFLDNPRLDVLALYGRARGGSHHISPTLRIVVGLVGTVCYVIKPHMAQHVSTLFMRGVADLERQNRRGKSDILWNQLQKKKFFFAAPVGSYARNREGYSDIESRHLGPR